MRLAFEAADENQFVAAQQLNHPPLLVAARFRLAYVLWRQGKVGMALPVYFALINMATDPQTSARLTDSARLLVDEEVGAYDRTIALAADALGANPTNGAGCAYRILAEAHSNKGENVSAVQVANEKLALARTMQSPRAILNSFASLAYVYYHAEWAQEAPAAVTQQLLWSRRLGANVSLLLPLRRSAEIRLLQARIVLDLPVDE